MTKRAASAALFIYTENVLGSQRGVSMKIIYIHGMNKQKFSSASLRQRWLSLLKRGLEQSHQQAHFAYLKRHIRIPFMATYCPVIIYIMC